MSGSDGAAFRPTIKKVASWKDARALLEDYPGGWVFRGQQKSLWRLTTALERLSTSLPLREREFLLLHSFKRQAHQYLAPQEEPRDELEWLALMQHHGTPTRMMDWTRSPYVATYFAFEHEMPAGGPLDPYRAIWAVNGVWLKAMESKVPFPRISAWDDVAVESRYGTQFEEIWSYEPHGIFMVEPFRLNVRLSLQQGVFLFPGNGDATFEDNLKAFCIMGPGIDQEHPEVHKILVPDRERIAVLNDVRRLNIKRVTLFPGLDGMAMWLPIELQTSYPPNPDE